MIERPSTRCRPWLRAFLFVLALPLGACANDGGATEPDEAAVQATQSLLATADPTRASGPPPPVDKASGEPFEGPVWVLAELGAEGRAPLPGTELTLQLLGSGLSGSAGCNTFGGSYEADSGRLSIRQLATSQMMCSAPEGVMQQESAYLGALQSAAGYQLSPGRFVLTSASGETLARFQASGE